MRTALPKGKVSGINKAARQTRQDTAQGREGDTEAMGHRFLHKRTPIEYHSDNNQDGEATRLTG